MVNPYRAEVSLVINGAPHLLCLTLGALAHLEQALNVKNLAELADRFSSQSLKTEDILILLEAALLGGGNPLSATQLAEADIEGGPAAAVSAIASLFRRSFGSEDNRP